MLAYWQLLLVTLHPTLDINPLEMMRELRGKQHNGHHNAKGQPCGE